MGRNLLEYGDRLTKRRNFGRFDDFDVYASGGAWTSIVSGSGSVTAGDSQGGIVTVAPIDSTDNLFAGFKTTNALFLFAANKPIHIEALIQFTEANTSAANVIFGLMSAASSSPLQSNGAGPKANCSGAFIYKADGGTVWKTGSSLGTTQTLSTSDKTAGGSSYQLLEIDINPISSTIAEVTYYVDQQQLKLATGRPGQNLIQDQLTYTGALQMNFFMGIMNGSTTPETLLVDYAAWEQCVRRFV